MKIAADNFKEFGTTEDIICPCCNEHVYMNLFKATNGLGVLNISLYNLNTQLFTVCPKCNSLFAVDEEITKRAAKERSNNHTMINEANITYLKKLG